MHSLRQMETASLLMIREMEMLKIQAICISSGCTQDRGQ